MLYSAVKFVISCREKVLLMAAGIDSRNSLEAILIPKTVAQHSFDVRTILFRQHSFFGYELVQYVCVDDCRQGAQREKQMGSARQRAIWGPAWEEFYGALWSRAEVANRIRSIADEGLPGSVQRTQPLQVPRPQWDAWPDG